MRREVSVDLTEREGDPAQGPIRYSVQSSGGYWDVTRASVGTSEVPCSPNAVPLAVDPKSSRFADFFRDFAVTVPRATNASALDLTLENREDGRTQCMRIPVEGEELEWRRAP